MESENKEKDNPVDPLDVIIHSQIDSENGDRYTEDEIFSQKSK